MWPATCSWLWDKAPEVETQTFSVKDKVEQSLKSGFSYMQAAITKCFKQHQVGTTYACEWEWRLDLWLQNVCWLDCFLLQSWRAAIMEWNL